MKKLVLALLVLVAVVAIGVPKIALDYRYAFASFF